MFCRSNNAGCSFLYGRRGLLGLFFLICLESATAQSPVHLRVSAATSGEAIPADFLGLSFEMQRVLPDSKNAIYFSPGNKPLVDLFRTLGIKSLRVGGNTADRPGVLIPSYGDIDNLFLFARAAGARVIYTFRLRGGNPSSAAETAKYIVGRYSAELQCFAIGNEPNVFSSEYSVFLNEWRTYVTRIRSLAPSAVFCGPGATPGKTAWSRDFVADAASSGALAFVTQHAYPGGSGRSVADPDSGRRAMLSPRWVDSYGKFSDSFVPAVLSNGFAFRIEETNSFYNGGAPNVSNTFASALWGLEYLFWWASQKSSGVNFHTGDSVAAGEGTNPCHYAVFTTSLSGYAVHPLGYAVKAFEIAAKGTMLQTTIASNPEGRNLTAYGVGDKDAVTVVLINKEINSRRSMPVVVEVDGTYARGQTMSLVVAGGDVSATSGVTLGGAGITENAAWNGSWSPMTQMSFNRFDVTVPAASAQLVRLTR